jgi:hypothetical protein
MTDDIIPTTWDRSVLEYVHDLIMADGDPAWSWLDAQLRIALGRDAGQLPFTTAIEPAARMGDPSTSHAAAAVQPRSIQVGNDFGDTLLAFWKHHPQPLNASEVTFEVSRSRRGRQRSMHRRVSDLARAGYLVHKGETRASIETGVKQRLFELTVLGEAVAAQLCQASPALVDDLDGRV